MNSQRDFFFQKDINTTDNELSSVPKSFNFFFTSIYVWVLVMSLEKLKIEISDDIDINK